MKKKWHKLAFWFRDVSINTWLLLLIVLMMFGEYSQKYYVGNWGMAWHIEVIAPVVYYLSGAVAIGVIVMAILSVALKLWLKESMNEKDS